MKKLTPQEVNNILVSGNFDELKGTVEHEQVECKGGLYDLKAEANKLELAKDVSALANSKGGVLLIGVKTSKDPSHQRETIDEIRCITRDKFDADRYRQILSSWIYPPIRALEIEWYPANHDTSRGLVCIAIGHDCQREKPFLVIKSEIDKKTSTKLVGYFERIDDDATPMSAQEFRERFKDGMRFVELETRLSNIEEILAQRTLGSVAKKSQTNIDQLIERMSETREAAALGKEPAFNLGACPTENTEFTKLFASHESPEVRLFDNLPVYRPFGFDLNASERSRILRAELRRRVVSGKCAVDLWKSGPVTFAGAISDRLLGWAVQREASGNQLMINNIALTEIVCLFFKACIELYQLAEPTPKHIKVLSELTTAGEEKQLCLGNGSLSSQWTFNFGWRSVEDMPKRFQADFELKSAVAEVEALKLLKCVYNSFGFEDTEIPYVDRKSVPERIDPRLFTGR